MSKRRRAREMAMQMLYQHELGGSALVEIFEVFSPEDSYLQEDDLQASGLPAGGTVVAQPTPKRKDGESHSKRGVAFAYAQRLVEGTVAHGEQIDALIRRYAKNWRLERMPAIDRNILRLALYEMLHERSVPKVVIVDEAIELAKKFGAENSGRFVNGLLDGVLKKSSELLAAATPAGGLD